MLSKYQNPNICVWFLVDDVKDELIFRVGFLNDADTMKTHVIKMNPLDSLVHVWFTYELYLFFYQTSVIYVSVLLFFCLGRQLVIIFIVNFNESINQLVKCQKIVKKFNLKIACFVRPRVQNQK